MPYVSHYGHSPDILCKKEIGGRVKKSFTVQKKTRRPLIFLMLLGLHRMNMYYRSFEGTHTDGFF